MAVQDIFSLQGRSAIVTGGTRGIGLAIARGLAEAGASVTVVGRDADRCEEAAAGLADVGYPVVGVAGHLGSLRDIEVIVATTVANFGTVDIIVNNAATPLSEPIGAVTASAFAKSMDVNVRGPMFLIETALPYLRRSRHASVVNVVSAGVWMFRPEVATYVASKAALVAYTRSAAAALVGDGIRVNALAPGLVETGQRQKSSAALYDELVAASVMRRAASVDEMVGPAVFLASDASSFITGSVLHVDGGAVAS